MSTGHIVGTKGVSTQPSSTDRRPRAVTRINRNRNHLYDLRYPIAVLLLCAGCAIGFLGALWESSPLLAVAGILLGSVLLVIPLPVAVAVWGASLAIWKLGPVSPSALDAFRLLFGSALALRYGKIDAVTRLEKRALTLLSALALVTVVFAVWRPDGRDLQMGFNMGVALLLSVAITRGPVEVMDRLMSGFIWGATASGIVAIGASVGLPLGVLSANQDAGTGRFAGLNSSAPLLSATLAYMVCLSWMRVTVERRMMYSAPLAIGILGILISGGRTGLFMLAAAAVVGVVQGRVKLRFVVPFLTLLLAFISWSSARGVSFDTLSRLTSPDASNSASGIDNGRSSLNASAWDSLLDHLWMGEGGTAFIGYWGKTAHTPYLVYATAGGVLALMLAIAFGLFLASLLLRPGPAKSTQLSLIPAAMLAYSMIEPQGPFSGVLNYVLLLLTCRAVSLRRVCDSPRSAERVIKPKVSEGDARSHAL